MVYLLMALAEEKTYSVQALPAAFMRSSNSMARPRWSRKFSSIMKNERTLSADSISHMTANNCWPVS